MPYLIPVKKVSHEIILDSYANFYIQYSDPLYHPDNGALIGTLGTVIVSNGIYVIFTTSYIISDSLYYLTIQKHNRSIVYFKVVNLSIRYQE